MAHGDDIRSETRRSDAIFATGARVVARLQRLLAQRAPQALARAAPYLTIVVVLLVLAPIADIFPPLWSDETHFLSMSAPWQSGHMLSPHALLKPEGVYWIPIGFYLFNASLFSLLGEVSVGVARAGSLLCTLLGAHALSLLHRRMLPRAPRSHAAWFAALWLVGPPILLAGNVARPEALVICLALFGLVAALSHRWLASVSVAVLALFVHPLIALPALVAGWLALLAPREARVRRAELVLPALALLLALAELIRFLAHRDAYLADWTYQLSRKSAREVGALPLLLFALVAFGALAPLAARFARARAGESPTPPAATTSARTAAALATVGLSAILVQAYGQEMWYASVRFTGVALLLLAATTLLHRSYVSPLLLALCLSLDLGSWARGFHKGLVQGIPLSSTGMRDGAREKRALDRLLTTALHAPTDGPTLISPFLAAPFIDRLQQGSMFVVSETSHPETKRFTRAVYMEHAYPHVLDDRETLTALSGYVCRDAVHVRTEHGSFDVVIAEVARADASPSGPFVPCEGPALARAPR